MMPPSEGSVVRVESALAAVCSASSSGSRSAFSSICILFRSSELMLGPWKPFQNPATAV